MLDEVHRVAIKMYGGGTGVTVREERPGEWFIQLYKSSYKEGNDGLVKKTGNSYADVVHKLHVYMEAEEKQFDERKKSKERYCYSIDGDVYIGDFSSEAEAIATFRKEHPGAHRMWVAKRVKPSVRELLRGQGYGVLEKLVDASVKFAGSSAEDWLDDVEAINVNRFEERLAKLLEEWLVEGDHLPAFFGTKDRSIVTFDNVQQVAE